jgi:DNA-directed RNA polymerase subunit RPC12/RpoP
MVTMGLAELTCPICSADFLLSGEEKPGEEVFCTYCGSPCRLKGSPYDEACEIEEEI